MQQLTTFNLANNMFGFNGALLLPEILSKMPQLTSLNLASNSLDMIGSILESCISNLTQLKILNLRNNNIRAFGMLSLVPIIANLPLLETLDIGSNGILTDGVRLLASIKLPKFLESALLNNDSHRLYLFLIEISTNFHSLWNIGKEDSSVRFIIKDNENLTIARLSLLKASALCINNVMAILGVDIKESM
jgi:Leucine-rich repeat (LRR) protein